MAYLAPGQNYYGAQMQPQGGMGQSGADSAPAVSGTSAFNQKKPGTGYWTNIQSYMGANQGAGQRMGQQVGQAIGQQAQELGQSGRESVQQQAQTGRQQAQSAVQPYENLQAQRQEMQGQFLEGGEFGGRPSEAPAAVSQADIDMINRYNQWTEMQGSQNPFEVIKATNRLRDYGENIAKSLAAQEQYNTDLSAYEQSQQDWDTQYQTALSGLEQSAQLQGAPGIETPELGAGQEQELTDLLSEVQGATSSELFDLGGMGDGRTLGENVLDRLLFSAGPQNVASFAAPVEQELTGLQSDIGAEQQALSDLYGQTTETTESDYQDLMDWINAERDQYGY